MDKAFKEQKKEEDKEKRKLKLLERKKEMNRPIDPFPKQQLCEYERLREKNIKEREEAMAASGLFEKLISYKVEIGMNTGGKNDKQKEK